MLPDRHAGKEAREGAFEKLPRLLRREIKKAGAEEAARAEISAAIEEGALELEPLLGPENAEAVASAFLPRLIAGGVLLKAYISEIETTRRSLREAIATPLPDDAAPETRLLVRLARSRVDTLTQYPREF
ncbi:MAG: hypothetical protein Q7S20_01315 [Gemmatimonadaceae bacterium]|nr:hypothetical protein [Gemmatimonadaceae bacterium]